jgi:hypothetical protein
VRIQQPGKLRAGEFAEVQLTGADTYDLLARAVTP